jgi:P4 family phage/plasmid primase-like protien
MPEESKQKTNPVYLSMDFIGYADKMLILNDEVYIWNGKFYEAQKKSGLYRKLWDFFETKNILQHLRRGKADEIIELLKMNPKLKEVEELDNYETLINLNNCIYDFETDATLNRSDQFLFSYALDIDYDKTAVYHPTFDTFVQNLFRNKGHRDEETEELLLYILAYLIYPKIKREALFMFLGGGENGKSILIEIIKMFFPKKYVTSLSLNVMSNEDSFIRAELLHSRLNISTEQRASSTQKVNSEEIKKISSGEDTTINPKHKEPINFKPKTKIVVASNSFPYFNDTSHGIDRRLFMLDFKNKFLMPKEYAAEAALCDPAERSIYKAIPKDELFAGIQKEKPAIFNTLIKYLHKLRANGWQFPVTENSQSIKKEYNEGADTLGSWLKENYEVNHNIAYLTSVLEILDEFNQYYRINYPSQKATSYSTQGVGRKIKDIFRIEGKREGKYIEGQQIKTTVYPIHKKDAVTLTDQLSNIQKDEEIDNLFSINQNHDFYNQP